MPPTSPQPKLPEQLAEAPFNDARADIILRSSDEVHFRVFKNILSLASLAFADMFGIPSPSPPSKKPHDEVQVVPLSEHSTALDFVLRHIYPVRRTLPPDADPLHYASILVEFARKYQVEVLDQFIIGYLTDSLEREPVGVYSIAVTYGYDDIGADAARACLDIPFSDLQSSYLRYATAEHISELFKYHVACGQVASAVATSNRSWFSSLAQGGILTPHRGNNCRSCLVPDFVNQTSSERGSGPLCVWNYFHRSALVLAHEPTSDAVTTEVFVLQTNDCPSCASFLRPYMIELSVVFGREIENAIEEVPLPKAVQVSVKSGSTTTATDSGSGSD